MAPNGREERRQWHLDKTFSVSHLIATVTMIASLAGVFFKMDNRVALVEQYIVTQRQTDQKQDADLAELRKSIKEDLRDLSAKMDRLIERAGK